MKRIRVLTIGFDTEINGYEIPAFRGAVIEKAGREHVAFHNHQGDNGFINKYPIIQYKVIHNKPSIFCIGDGVDEVHHFFENRELGVTFSGKTLDLKVFNLHMNEITMQVWNNQWNYRIKNWLGLNEDNYTIYLNTESLSDRIKILEKVLVGNILSFAKTIQWTVDRPIELKIRKIVKEGWSSLKGIKLKSFDIEFSTNVYLPQYIGLGKSASHGFGTVTSQKKKSNSQDSTVFSNENELNEIIN